MLSNKYNIYNGVKHGRCLPHTLFSIYLNDLIDVLRSSDIGCRYGNHYMGNHYTVTQMIIVFAYNIMMKM